MFLLPQTSITNERQGTNYQAAMCLNVLWHHGKVSAMESLEKN
jgi:hypothetical protein